MRDSTFLEEEFNREDLAACSSILASDSDNFTTLVAVAGMNPSTDFINADLSGCDLANSDVRGFNFSGADLRGVTLMGTVWDSSTILTNADIRDTAFVFDQEQNKFFKENPRWDRFAQSMASSDWMGVEIWLGKDREDEKDIVTAARVAFKLYGLTDKPYVKSVILYHSRHQFAEQDAYRDFLLAELARINSQTVLTTCLTIVGRMFPEDRQTKAACRALLAHEAEIVRRAALTALMNGIRGASMPGFLVEYIRDEPSGEIRRYYLGRVVRRMSELHEAVAREERTAGLYRDFKSPISNDTVNDLADNYVRASDTVEIELTPDEAQVPTHIKDQRGKDKFRDRRRRRKLVRMLFEDFRLAGLPFEIR